MWHIMWLIQCCNHGRWFLVYLCLQDNSKKQDKNTVLRTGTSRIVLTIVDNSIRSSYTILYNSMQFYAIPIQFYAILANFV